MEEGHLFLFLYSNFIHFNHLTKDTNCYILQLMQKFKMIAMDLDGTTLQDDHETFTPRLIEALTEAHRNGVLIVPCTGRPYKSIPPAIQNHPVWEGYGIFANGEEIRDMRTGEKLQELLVEPHIAETLLDMAEKYDFGIEFYINGFIYLTQGTYDKESATEDLLIHQAEVVDKIGIITDDMRGKLKGLEGLERIQMLCIPEKVREEIFEKLKPLHISVLSSWMGSEHMEVTHFDAHKGKALKTLCSMIDIDIKDVIAFGDEGNDVSMIQMAGFGVAMENGPEVVQQAADFVAKANTEDGAAIAIEKYVLGM